VILLAALGSNAGPHRVQQDQQLTDRNVSR
jgi:hypothetical protein